MDKTTLTEGLRHIETWPREEVEFAAKLPVGEQAMLVEAAALLKITPVPPKRVVSLRRRAT